MKTKCSSLFVSSICHNSWARKNSLSASECIQFDFLQGMVAVVVGAYLYKHVSRLSCVEIQYEVFAPFFSVMNFGANIILLLNKSEVEENVKIFEDKEKFVVYRVIKSDSIYIIN